MTPRALILLLFCRVVSAVTLYGVQGVLTPGVPTTTPDTASGTSVYDPPTETGLQAFNPVILAPPAVPSPPITNQFWLPLSSSAQNAANNYNVSIQQDGAFLGLSIEMSVINQVIGLNGSFLHVPFLNLMALVAERAGSVRVRVGGNTQDYAVEVDSLPDYKMVMKDKADSRDTTETPTMYWTPEMLYLLSNVSSHVNVKWWLGIPFNDTSNLRLQIAEMGEAILGDKIIGFQLGNEPDLYAMHNHRPANYNASDYFNDFAMVSGAISDDPQIPVHNNLVAPGVSGTWTPEQVWDTGFVPAFSDVLNALAVEHYPENNCAAQFPNEGFGPPVDPQSIFPTYLTHASGQGIVAAYLNSANIAQQAGKPLLMFETNTASCGGFPGVSDSFGAALWGIDYSLQMAYSNFSGANMHVGGVDDNYNPFTPPPSNLSSWAQWTIGPIFYSIIVSAEALGSTGTAQVVDLNANSYNPYTPAYAIYEQGTLARVALVNYLSDTSGASTLTVNVTVGGAGTVESASTPAQVRVKYLLAESVAVKEGFTWAGQTMGNRFASDGRLLGNETVQTVQCDQSTNTCQVTVPAPGFALVFMTDTAFNDASPSSTATFATTTHTYGALTVRVSPSVLATSNGDNAGDRDDLGSTSKGSSGAERSAGVASGVVALVALLAGASVLRGALRS